MEGNIMDLKWTSYGMVALLGLMAVAAPVAMAQTTTFQVGTPTLDDDSIQPDLGTSILTVPWIYSAQTPVQTPFTAVSANIIISWVFDCANPNVLISGSRTTIVPVAVEGTQTTVTEEGEATFTVSVTQEAPGETKIPCDVTGTATALNAQGATAPPPSTASFAPLAEYLGLIGVTIPKTIKQAGPQKEITYVLDISNLGNSRSNINFQLVSDSKGKWEPVIPAPVPLESKAQGGTDTTKQVGFTVSTPFKNGWNNEQTTFQLEILPVSTKDAQSFGQAVPISVLARVRGVYVPTLEPMLMLGAVLASALVVRLARKEE